MERVIVGDSFSRIVPARREEREVSIGLQAPKGKPAGVRCAQLLPDFRCAIFGRPERPAVCVSLRPTEAMCGSSQAEAMDYLTKLEARTAPEAEAWRRDVAKRK